MENFSFYVVCIAIAVGTLLFIAEPHRFMPEETEKKKKVGSTYWGIYEGTPIVEPESMRTIEVVRSTRKGKNHCWQPNILRRKRRPDVRRLTQIRNLVSVEASYVTRSRN